MLKVDLHTHSVASPDGALSVSHYHRMLENGGLDYVAITDHNTIGYALQVQRELGSHIIVGEEIMTKEGEVIGLYLEEPIPENLTILETIHRIQTQSGLVYIPHPFETFRKGIPLSLLDTIVSQIDIVEAYNGRTAQNRSRQGIAFATSHNLPFAASSDAHGWHGWGKTFTALENPPTHASLTMLLRTASYHVGSPGIYGRLYPKANRLRKKFKHV